ncbi:MAG TPA: hypothetical protein VGC96_06085, partial [Candidatus Elarobacter sp.]
LTLAVTGTVNARLFGNEISGSIEGFKVALSDARTPLVQDVPMTFSVAGASNQPVKLGLLTAGPCPSYVDAAKRGTLSISDPKQNGVLAVSYKACGAVGLPRFFAVQRSVQLFGVKPSETPATDPATGTAVTNPADPTSEGLLLVFDNVGLAAGGIDTRTADFYVIPNGATTLNDRLFQLTSGRFGAASSSCKKDDPLTRWIFVPFAKVCLARLDITKSPASDETELEVSGTIQPLRVVTAPDLFGSFDAAYMAAKDASGPRFHLHADFTGAQIKSGDETITVSSFDIDYQDTKRSIDAEVSVSSQALKGATVYVRRLGFEETRASVNESHWTGKPVFAIDKGRTNTSFAYTLLANAATLLFAHFVSPIRL